MICPSSTPNQVLALARFVATELAAEALDPAADLTMPERRALAEVSLAADAEASRRAGVDPVANVRDVLTESLAAIETNPFPGRTGQG